MDKAAEETWSICQKLEKFMTRALRPGESGADDGDVDSEIEYLRRSQRKMKMELGKFELF
jgi:hypothetical protein